MRYWKRVDNQELTTTVESYSHDLGIEGAIEISEEEFNDYLASLPEPVVVVERDLAAEIDSLKARLAVLEHI